MMMWFLCPLLNCQIELAGAVDFTKSGGSIFCSQEFLFSLFVTLFLNLNNYFSKFDCYRRIWTKQLFTTRGDYCIHKVQIRAFFFQFGAFNVGKQRQNVAQISQSRQMLMPLMPCRKEG